MGAMGWSPDVGHGISANRCFLTFLTGGSRPRTATDAQSGNGRNVGSSRHEDGIADPLVKGFPCVKKTDQTP